MARSPPGVTTLLVDSGFECIGLNPMCDSVKNAFFFSFLEYENSKIVKSSGEATCVGQNRVTLLQLRAKSVSVSVISC